MLVDTLPTPVSAIAERDVRRQIDRSVSRALTDRDYATLLLSNPTVALEDHGCPPQQYKRLRSISADSVLDFAQQAYALFWAEPIHQPLDEEDQLLLAAAAR